MAHKGVVLYSGGLDSLLAAKLLMEQGLDVTGFHCVLPFAPKDFVPEESYAARLASQINLPLVYYICDREYIAMVRSPEHGRGKHINPCIDCKIFFIKKAGEYMKKIGADFVATGEVVGQRPMSQMKNTMIHIAKETGLEGRLLRPLSALLLKPTLAEEQGVVNRAALLGISGRGRKPQMELAAAWGIREYASPAGGCLMTDANVSRRIEDLFSHNGEVSANAVRLTAFGRHFRINERTKLVVARNESEGIELAKYADEADALFVPEFKGPAAILLGSLTDETQSTAAAIISRYGSPSDNDNKITVTAGGAPAGFILARQPASEESLDAMRI